MDIFIADDKDEFKWYNQQNIWVTSFLLCGICLLDKRCSHCNMDKNLHNFKLYGIYWKILRLCICWVSKRIFITNRWNITKLFPLQTTLNNLFLWRSIPAENAHFCRSNQPLIFLHDEVGIRVANTTQHTFLELLWTFFAYIILLFCQPFIFLTLHLIVSNFSSS